MSRKCSICGKEITQGYVIEGMYIFCSKKCLSTVIAKELEKQLFLGDYLYWTYIDEDNNGDELYEEINEQLPLHRTDTDSSNRKVKETKDKPIIKIELPAKKQINDDILDFHINKKKRKEPESEYEKQIIVEDF